MVWGCGVPGEATPGLKGPSLRGRPGPEGKTSPANRQEASVAWNNRFAFSALERGITDLGQARGTGPVRRAGPFVEPWEGFGRHFAVSEVR